jgi:hypothetical protein
LQDCGFASVAIVCFLVGGANLRVTVDIPETDMTRIDEPAEATNVSRAHLIWEAIGIYSMRKIIEPIDAGFGAWRGPFG